MKALLFQVVFFSTQAVDPDLDSPNAHSCPGKDLSLAMSVAFLAAFARTAHGQGPVASRWKLVEGAAAGGGPDPISLVGPTDFTLRLD